MCSHAAVMEAQLHFNPVAGDRGRNQLLHNSSLSRAAAVAVARFNFELLIWALSCIHVYGDHCSSHFTDEKSETLGIKYFILR